MAAYSLRPDETILYERDVTIQGQERSSRLMLTNLNIVITEYVKSSLLQRKKKRTQSIPFRILKYMRTCRRFFRRENTLEFSFFTKRLVLILIL